MDPEKEGLISPQLSPTLQVRKWMLIAVFSLRHFLAGVEYSIILPTALLYVRSLSGGHSMMGFVIAAYPLAALITSPLFGYLYDRTKQVMWLLFLLNIFEIIGNFLYAIPYSKWLLLVGRFFAGLGDGITPLVLGEITYLYDESEIVGMLSLVELGRVTGVLIGPSINFFIKGKTIHTGGWVCDDKCLPGIIMGCIWMVMQCITLACVYNSALEIIENSKANDSTSLLQDKVCIGNEVAQEIENEVEKETEHTFNLESKNSCLFSGHSNNDKAEEMKQDETCEFTVPTEGATADKSSTMSQLCDKKTNHNISGCSDELLQQSQWRDMFSLEILVLYLVIIVIWYSLTTCEIFIPYITEFEYKWEAQETGVIYMAAGGIMLTSFVLMYGCRRCFARNDIYILITAITLHIVSNALMTLEKVPTNTKTRYIVLLIMVVLEFISVPLLLVSIKSIRTKLVEADLQGQSSGIASGVCRIGMILGPVLFANVCNHRQIYGSVMSSVSLITLICLLLSLGRIAERQKLIKYGNKTKR